MTPEENHQFQVGILHDEINRLRDTISRNNAEIDILRRRVRVLEAARHLCGDAKILHSECRIWLVMNDMLKSKYRVRRDGR